MNMLKYCQNCKAIGCCTTYMNGGEVYPAFLTDADIERISTHTPHNPSDFVTEMQVQTKQGYRSIKVVKYLNGGGCMFFDFDTKLCNVYSVRPLDCRLFPLDIVEHEGQYWWIGFAQYCGIPKGVFQQIITYAEVELLPEFEPYLFDTANEQNDLTSRGKFELLQPVRLVK